MSSETSNEVRRVLDNFIQALRALENLGRQVSDWDDWLVFILSSKLDQATRKDWETSVSNSTDIPTFHSLQNFLEGRLHILDAIKGVHSNERKASTNIRSIRSASRIHHISSARSCLLCQQKHILLFCPLFKTKSVEERISFIQRQKLCTNCLRSGHTLEHCPSGFRCKHCNLKHHSMLHKGSTTTFHQATASSLKEDNGLTFPIASEISTSTNAHVVSSTISSGSVLLPTAVVNVRAPNGRTISGRALVDQGSESNFITAAFAKLLQLPAKRIHIPVLGVGDCQAGLAKSLVTYEILSTKTQNNVFTVQALVLPKLTNLLPSRTISKQTWPHISGIELADPDFHIQSRVYMILGADVYSRILMSGVRQGPLGSPIAQQTALGWILSGTVQDHTNTLQSTVSLHCSSEVDLCDLLRNFWELEELPTKPPLTPEEEECESFFKTTHKRDETGRYIVYLPVKTSNIQLGNSKQPATMSLIRMERRFSQDAQLHSDYSEFINEYQKLNHMEEVSSEVENISRSYYLPHHAVLKPSSTTTKLRVVFNASKRTDTGNSLNDLLHVGPKLQNDVSTIIMKWRIYPFVFSADIEKMFRQIRIDCQDTDLQRILWRPTPKEPIKCFRLTTVTYGTACAPYLACRTLQQLADDHQSEFPLGSEILRENFYVDDALFGAFNESDALKARNEINGLLEKGRFKLRKWLSNSSNLLSDIPDEDKELATTVRLVSDDNFKMLGIYWNPSRDQFLFQIQLTDVDVVTKRDVLSDVSRVYDPLGWLSPITITAKIFMQKLWTVGLGWDEKLPIDLERMWTKYKQDLKELDNLAIDRWIGINDPHVHLELHGFCDASLVAYGAVVYLRIIHDLNNAQTSLIAAKTKVSPLKTISLPRLELCGAALLSKLILLVQKTLKLETAIVHTWTDSTIVLAWLKDHPSRWKTFVANRVSTIHEKLPTAVWRHVSSQDNPADCVTRGMDSKALMCNQLWWSGPSWLSQHSTHWPCNTPQASKCSILVEQRATLTHTVRVENLYTELLNQYSTFTKLIRVTAYCRRFIRNSQANKHQTKRTTGKLLTAELHNALNWLIIQDQHVSYYEDIEMLSKRSVISRKSSLRNLNPFIDDEGILRVGGRLKNSLLSFDQKHPVIISKDSPLTQLIINNAHRSTLHGGIQLTLHHIRDKYWIINGRGKVRQFVRNCIICYRYRATSKTQIMADLPSDRIRPAKPFLNSGVDFAGPMTIKCLTGRGQKTFKSYVAVFVCLVTRAIHLELVMDLSAEAFLAAFKRFVARRGHCAKIYSDNATNFVSADKQLTQHLRQLTQQAQASIRPLLLRDGTEWHFIPPAAPHFGGMWESGVKSLKHHLRRVVGTHILTIQELLTLLAQIEACLNSRPLHPISDDPEDFTALTPGHFW